LATRVAVFGSSEAVPGERAWEDAERTGALLAAAGYEVVNGGYGGVMEACSRGASEAGGRAIGVTCTEFGRGKGNRWLAEDHPEDNLFDRTRSLIEISEAYIILPGRAGTLAELAFLWALHRGGILRGAPVVLLGAWWDGLVDDLLSRGLLERSQADATSHAATPEEAVSIVREQVIPR
jgi:hypothetical protein